MVCDNTVQNKLIKTGEIYCVIRHCKLHLAQNSTLTHVSQVTLWWMPKKRANWNAARQDSVKKVNRQPAACIEKPVKLQKCKQDIRWTLVGQSWRGALERARDYTEHVWAVQSGQGSWNLMAGDTECLNQHRVRFYCKRTSLLLYYTNKHASAKQSLPAEIPQIYLICSNKSSPICISLQKAIHWLLRKKHTLCSEQCSITCLCAFGILTCINIQCAGY